MKLQPHRRSILGVPAVAAAALGLALVLGSGCGDDDDGGPGPGVPTSHIDIVMGAATQMDQAFSPNPDTVTTGTRVVWTNRDTQTHRILSDGGHFPNSGDIAPGSTYTVTFTALGTHPYHCPVAGHDMTGAVVVVP